MSEWAVRVVDNPDRIQAAGLNRALEARGEIIVRVDAHCVIAPEYVERCVDALSPREPRWWVAPCTQWRQRETARAVATAMRSTLGAGPARFHVGGDAGWVDTVYLGAYSSMSPDGRWVRRGPGGQRGCRVRDPHPRKGGIWFDPSIYATYSPRSTVHEVARQFYRYGFGRAATMRRHPSSVKAVSSSRRPSCSDSFRLGGARWQSPTSACSSPERSRHVEKGWGR